MRLFYLRTSDEQLQLFAQENYISIEASWLTEDLEHMSWEEICERYSQAIYHTELHLFLAEIEDGDLVIATDGNRAYVGDMGDYFYVEPNSDQSDLESVTFCSHRRGVTWLKSVELELVDEWLRRLGATSEAKLYKITDHISFEELEATLNEVEQRNRSMVNGGVQYVDEATIQEAIQVLQQALRSEDAERRERAAIALLGFAKR